MLTLRQKQLLDFIRNYVQDQGVSPSFEEMRHAMGLKSKSGIHRLVSSLEERGFIRRLAYRARAVELIKTTTEPAPPPKASGQPDIPAPGYSDIQTPDEDMAPAMQPGEAHVDLTNVVRGNFRTPTLVGQQVANRLPLAGKIAAGSPIEALSNMRNEVDVPAMMVGRGEHYVLQIEGDSMIDAGIMDGDLAVIKKCETAPNGTIVVALVDGKEATLKRLRRRGATIALEPANTAYETRIFGSHRVEVQGQLVGLMRCY